MAEAVINPKSDDATQPVPNVPTVGVGSKEAVGRADIQASEALPRIEREISDFVKPSQPLTPNIPGIVAPAAEAVPVTTEKSYAMKKEEADRILKENPSKFHLQENVGDNAGVYTEDSLPFFAALMKKFYQRMNNIKNAMRTMTRKPA